MKDSRTNGGISGGGNYILLFGFRALREHCFTSENKEKVWFYNIYTKLTRNLFPYEYKLFSTYANLKYFIDVDKSVIAFGIIARHAVFLGFSSFAQNQNFPQKFWAKTQNTQNFKNYEFSVFR